MVRKIVDYSKCVLKNKVALSSYAAIFLPLLAKCIEENMGVELPVPDNVLLGTIGTGFAFLSSSEFGFETLRAYDRAKNQIKRFGRVDYRYREREAFTYCRRVGTDLAIQEAGLEGTA